MGFVNDNQIKMAGTEQPLPGLVGRFYLVEDGVIGGDDDPAFPRFFVFQQVDGIAGGQMRFECLDGLTNQRRAVGQEEDALDPIGPHEQVCQGHGRARFPRTCSHDQQGAAVALAEMFRHVADGRFLVVAVYDGFVDRHLGRIPGCLPPLHQQLQLVPGVKSLHLARRVELVIPQADGVAVGVEDDGTLAVHLFQGVGVQFGLLFAPLFVHAGLFGFDDGQRQAISPPQHIVGKAKALAVGHGFHALLNCRHLRNRVSQRNPVSGAFKNHPPRFPQQDVNEDLACFRFGVAVILIVGDGFVDDFGGSHLRPQPFDFGFEPGFCFPRLAQFFIAFQVGFGQLFKLRPALLRHFPRRRRQFGFVEPVGDGVGVAFGVGAGKPMADVEEHLDHGHGFGGADGTAVMHRVVSQLTDGVHFVLDAVRYLPFEGGVGHQGGQFVVVGAAEGGIIRIQPFDYDFDGATAVKQSRPRI